MDFIPTARIILNCQQKIKKNKNIFAVNFIEWTADCKCISKSHEFTSLPNFCSYTNFSVGLRLRL